MYPFHKPFLSTLLVPSPCQVPPQKLSFSLPDGAIQGKCHHDNTLRHTWPRLGLKGLAFYVRKKAQLFVYTGEIRTFIQSQASSLGITFPPRIHLALGLASLTHEAGLVILFPQLLSPKSAATVETLATFKL